MTTITQYEILVATPYHTSVKMKRSIGSSEVCIATALPVFDMSLLWNQSLQKVKKKKKKQEKQQEEQVSCSEQEPATPPPGMLMLVTCVSHWWCICIPLGRAYTVSVALPGSIIANAQTAELRTCLAGQVARALAIFSVDEVVVFDEQTPASTG